jgi:PhzF family phenazine biosynthesis protein
MARDYFVIDAFTGTPYSGNPAAVVLDAEGLADEQMQAIAAEFNLSETTFILPSERRDNQDTSFARRFRWFTPAAEVTMCGHATVAGLHALVESGRIPEPAGITDPTTVRIETLGGMLTGFIERMPGPLRGRMIWLELVSPALTTFPAPIGPLAEALGAATEAVDVSLPPATTQDNDLIVFVKDFVTLNALAPSFGPLAAWLTDQRIRGLCVATVRTVTPSVHVQSRFFAPSVGIDEDPVTGSVHGPLAAYLADRGMAPSYDGVAALVCTQGRPGGRVGRIHALVGRSPDGARWVRIGGEAVVTMRGQLVQRHSQSTGRRADSADGESGGIRRESP